MPLFTPYFSLDSSAFRVGNGGRLRCRMGASGIGIYVMLLSHLRDCRDCRAPLDYDMLAFDLHEDAAAVRRVVEEFGLFDIDRSSGTFTSSVLTTVRGLLSDDGAAAGVGTTRTVRQRRVRSAGETYRRAVRRLAEDNALPPAEEEAPAEGDAEPAEEAPTSSPNAITPAEGEHPFAEEVNATGNFAPTSIAAEAAPAEVKNEAADAEGTPAEGEHPAAEEKDVPTAFADAHSPRREENRKEQNKKPHTPIVPFPQSGKGTRANHPAAAAVGAQEGGDASAEGDEEPLVGNPLSLPSASAERDAPPCAASPTVLGTPAQTLDPHPSTDTEKGTTNVPNSQPNPLTASEKITHPQTLDTHPSPDAANPNERDTHPSGKMQNGASSVPNGESSAEKEETSTNHSQPNPLTASEKTTHPNPDAANGTTSGPNSQANPENGRTSMPNSQTDTTNSPTSTTDAQPNALTTSEKANEASRGEEGAVEAFVPPTANEVRRFAETLHHPEFDAEWFVAYYTERHWRRHNGRPVVSWQTTARYWLDYPLRVARHLLDHRPTASPVSVGVGTASAVVVPPAGTTAAKPVGTSTYPAAGPTSSPSPGTHPVGTGSLSPRSSASPTSPGTYPVGTGAPHVGSLSLPAPTPLQQSRLSDLKGMVLHLFADAPAAAPASASTASDLSAAAPDVPAAAANVPANASTPDWVTRNSVRPARVLSPAEAAQVIAQQNLSLAEAEAVPRVVHNSTTDAEEIIDTQASPTNAAEAFVRACDDSTDEDGEGIDAQAFSTDDAEASVRACDNSTDEDGEGIETQVLSPAAAEKSVRACHDSTTDATKEIETQALSPADAEESVRSCDNSTDEDGEEIGTQAFSTADAEEDTLNGYDSTTDAAKGFETQALSPADAKESVRACDNSTTDATKEIETQALSPADAEESVRACDDSTDEDEEDIDAQALSPADAKESVRACDDSTDEDEEDIDALPFSTADTEESVSACDNSTDEDGEDIGTQAFSTTDAAKDIDAQAFSTNEAEEGARNGHDSTTADAAKDIETQAFSADKGRWGVRSPRGPDPPTDDGHDSNAIRHAGTDAENNFTAKPSNFSADRHPPAAVGTALAADLPIFAANECRPLHTFTEKHPYLNPSFHESHPLLRLHPPSFGGFGCTFRVQSVQPPFGRPFLGRFVDIRPACTVGSRPLRPRLTLCRTERGRCRLEHPDREHHRSADTVEHAADGRKNADFIDADPVHGHKTERNAAEHPDDERKRHDPAAEHPAYDPDAGQRLLDTAAHRRAVRAEREACCGALRHLAHCCVAF